MVINKSYGQVSPMAVAAGPVVLAARMASQRKTHSDKLVLARVAYLKDFLQKEISPLITFPHTISVAWKSGRYHLTITATDSVCREIWRKELVIILDMLDNVKEFLKYYAPSTRYEFGISGRGNWHNAKIVFVPGMTIKVKEDHCNEKIFQWFQIGLNKLEEIFNEHE